MASGRIAGAAPAATTASAGVEREAGAGAGIEGEADLLVRARAAVGGDPARALSLVKEHERRFPGGALVQEREVIAVSALVGLGRMSEARPRAARFLEQHPSSVYRRRLDMLVPGLPARAAP